jgi:hypothetical protein
MVSVVFSWSRMTDQDNNNNNNNNAHVTAMVVLGMFLRSDRIRIDRTGANGLYMKDFDFMYALTVFARDHDVDVRRSLSLPWPNIYHILEQFGIIAEPRFGSGPMVERVHPRDNKHGRLMCYPWLLNVELQN